jgi:hypothetical protein
MSLFGTKRRLAQCGLTSAVGGAPEMVERLFKLALLTQGRHSAAWIPSLNVLS